MTIAKKLLLGTLAIFAALRITAGHAQGVVNGLPNLNAFCTAQGSVIFRSANKWTCIGPGTSGQILKTGGAGADVSWTTAAGSGTVTSVAATVPADETVTGSPVTVTGTLAITRNSQAANLHLASPDGSSGVPSFRALAVGDLPTVTIAKGGTGQITASAAFNALSPVTSTGDLIIGNGANSSTRLAIGGNGTALTSNGTTASWGSVGIAGGGTGQATASAAFNALSPVTSTGDLIIGNGANSSTRLPIGSNNFCLVSNATTALWASCPTSFSGGTLATELTLATPSGSVMPFNSPMGSTIPAPVNGDEWNFKVAKASKLSNRITLFGGNVSPWTLGCNLQSNVPQTDLTAGATAACGNDGSSRIVRQYATGTTSGALAGEHGQLTAPVNFMKFSNGFVYLSRFKVATLVATSRILIGVTNAVVTGSQTSNTDPCTTTYAGYGGAWVCVDTNTGNWNFVYSNAGGTANVVTGLGTNIPLNTTDEIEVLIWCDPSASSFNYLVTDVTTGNSVGPTNVAVIPDAGAAVAPRAFITSTGTVSTTLNNYLTVYAVP